MVDLSYNFKCDRLILTTTLNVISLLNCPIHKLSDNKVSDNKLSDNNFPSELVGNRSSLKSITIEEIVIFMINTITALQVVSKIKNCNIVIKQLETCRKFPTSCEQTTNSAKVESLIQESLIQSKKDYCFVWISIIYL